MIKEEFRNVFILILIVIESAGSFYISFYRGLLNVLSLILDKINVDSLLCAST